MLVAENTVAVLRHLQPDGGERAFVRKARRAGFDGFWRERRRWKISVFGATPIGNETDFILLPCFIHVFLSGFCQVILQQNFGKSCNYVAHGCHDTC